MSNRITPMVTVKQFAEFLKATGRALLPAWDQMLKSPRCPVAWVSWWDADTYCKWVGGRLITSAEFDTHQAEFSEGGMCEWTSTEGFDSQWPDPQAKAMVIRGGAFYDHERFARYAVRKSTHPDLRNDNLGFRVVLPARKQLP